MNMNNVLFICYSTPNYDPLTSKFLKSLHDIGVTQIDHLLDKVPENIASTSGFQSPIWYYSVFKKIEYLVNRLKHHRNTPNDIQFFIFSDCDIWFPTQNVNKWNAMLQSCSTKKAIYFMREHKSDDVNSGFFIMPKDQIDVSISFFETVINTMKTLSPTQMPYGDQSVVNDIKHTIPFGFIENKFVIWGTCIWDKQNALFHHAVGTGTIAGKLRQMEQIRNRMKIK
jgi:hypothetical protein